MSEGPSRPLPDAGPPTETSEQRGGAPARVARTVVQAGKGITLGFANGMAYPFRGARFVYFEHFELIRIWIIPIAITCVLAVLTLFGTTRLASTIFEGTAGGTTNGVLLRILAVFVGIVVGFVGLLVVVFASRLIAAPFNDLLSEEVEAILAGNQPPPFTLRRLIRDGWRSVRIEALKLAIYALVMLPLFLFQWLVPVAGQALYIAFGWLFTSAYFAIDYIDWPASRRNAGIRERIALFRANASTMLGFGIGVWFFLFIPIVNLLFMPAAAAGGTMLLLDIEAAGRAPVNGESASPSTGAQG